MEKKLIYRDDRMIDLYKYCYRQGITELQAIIDRLAGQGIPLSDNVLKDLYGGGTETKDRLLSQINEETAKQKFQVLKDEIKKSTEALPYKIDEAVNDLRRARNVSSGGRSVYIDLDHLIVKDLKISLVPDFEEIITEQFSIYADNPSMAEAYERALKLEKEINDFADWLRERGDALRPVTDESYIGTIQHRALVSIKQDGGARILPGEFQSLFWKRPIR